MRMDIKEDVILPALTGLGIATLFIGLWLHNDTRELSAIPSTVVLAAEEESTIETEYVEPQTEPELVSLGKFRITYYCSCKLCTTDGDGITKTGTIATAGRTIGVDPDVIPLDSKVIINGHEYVAEDTGSGIKGKEIDLFMNSHEEALENGVDYEEVWVWMN